MVRVRNFRGGKEKWVPGVMVKKLGTLTFLVKVGERVRYVHADHVLPTGEVDEMMEKTSEHIMVPEPVLVPVPSHIPRSRVEQHHRKWYQWRRDAILYVSGSRLSD